MDSEVGYCWCKHNIKIESNEIKIPPEFLLLCWIDVASLELKFLQPYLPSSSQAVAQRGEVPVAGFWVDTELMG